MEKRGGEKASNLVLKDNIGINDLKIKVNKLLTHGKNKNVRIVTVCIKTTADKAENAKNLLLNFKDITNNDMREVGSIKEFAVNKEDNEIPIGDEDNPVIDMSPADIKDILDEENANKLYIKQSFELFRSESEEEDTRAKEKGSISELSLSKAVDKIFEKQSVRKDGESRGKQAEIMVYRGF